MSKYEVQEWCLCGGWTNTWTHTQDGSDEPVYFMSREGAEAELKAYLDDIKEDAEAGFLVDVPSPDSYRVVEVKE